MRLRLNFVLLFLLAACATRPVQPPLPAAPSADLPFAVASGFESLAFEKKIRWRSLPNLNEEAAQAFVAGQVAAAEAFLQPDMDPYTGTPSLAPHCMRPQVPATIKSESESQTVQAVSLYSSTSLVFGSCPRGGGGVKTQHVILYCRQTKAAFAISFFLPIHSDWPKTALASCLKTGQK